MSELEELKHDIAEYVKVSSEMANEIVAQQAEIERLKVQRDRLLEMLKTIDMKYAFGDCEPVQELISEIEAEK